MQATNVQIAQANDSSFIRELYSAASQYVEDDYNVEVALKVIELIEEGKYLEAVMLDMNF